MENNNPAPGNGPAIPIAPQPVTNEENKKTHHLALSCDAVFQQSQKDLLALRARQAAYLASIPEDPAEKRNAILGLLDGKYDRIPDEFHTALNLSAALECLVKHGELDVDTPNHAAASFIAELVSDNLRTLQGKLHKIWDLAEN